MALKKFADEHPPECNGGTNMHITNRHPWVKYFGSEALWKPSKSKYDWYPLIRTVRWPKVIRQHLEYKASMSKKHHHPKNIAILFTTKRRGAAWRTGSRQLPINPSLAEWSGPALSSKACIHNQCSIYIQVILQIRCFVSWTSTWSPNLGNYGYLPSLRVPGSKHKHQSCRNVTIRQWL